MIFFTLKIIKNSKVVKKYTSHFQKRFVKNLRTINWQDGPLKVYLKVDYGKHLDNYNKLSSFYNDGIYERKKDLWLAFEAFTEKGRSCY